VPEWFPGGSFKRQAKVWCKYTTDMLVKPFQAAKELIVSPPVSVVICFWKKEKIYTYLFLYIGGRDSATILYLRHLGSLGQKGKS
jgi:hypothetical protein